MATREREEGCMSDGASVTDRARAHDFEMIQRRRSAREPDHPRHAEVHEVSPAALDLRRGVDVSNRPRRPLAYGREFRYATACRAAVAEARRARRLDGAPWCGGVAQLVRAAES